MKIETTTVEEFSKGYKFRNYYYCPSCDVAWEDEWNACCDDRCPNCDISYSPIRSEDII